MPYLEQLVDSKLINTKKKIKLQILSKKIHESKEDQVIIITGSRSWHPYNDYRIAEFLLYMKNTCTETNRNLVIVHGDCPIGVDSYVKEWCYIYDIKQILFPVDTKIDGPWPKAGIRRNARMLNSSVRAEDRLVAFRSDGESRGTDHCVRTAKLLGIWTTIIFENRTRESLIPYQQKTVESLMPYQQKIIQKFSPSSSRSRNHHRDHVHIRV